MNTEPEYKRFQFTIADLLAVMVIVAVLGATSRVPASLFHAIPLFAVLYVVKYRILSLQVRPCVALLLYLVVVAVLLLYVYFGLIDVRETIAYGNPLSTWVGTPIMAFTVPTAFFLYDIFAKKQQSLGFYALRSLLEVALLVPSWALVWVSIEMSLGWLGVYDGLGR
ncbi:MAG: hypothetical protein ACLP9L_07320 [Thermoguttaceae bacterium]